MNPSLRRAALLAALLAAPALARATGAALVAGPVTIPADLCDPDEPAERGLRLFATPVAVRTTENLAAFEPALRVQGAVAGIQRRGSEDLTLMLAAGVLGGTIDPGDGVLDLKPGLTVQAAVTWRVVAGYDEDPFLLATVGFAHFRSESEDGWAYRSTDLSFSLALGKGFGGFAPYLAAKAFGGPVTWHHAQGTHEFDLRGNDRDHFQVAAGLVALLGRGFDVQAEVSPWAAQAVLVSIGWTR